MYSEGSLVKFSRRDRERKIRVPPFNSPGLAELVGVIIGDGNLYSYKKANKTIITFTGGNPNDRRYYNERIIPLIKTLFNTEPILREYGNWFVARIFSKAVFTFLTEVVKIPQGKKANIVSIPTEFLNNRRLLIPLIRGIADTDFSLSFKEKHKNVHYYPVLKLGCASRILVQQLHEALNGLGIVSNVQFDCREYHKKVGKFYTKHYLNINGKANLEAWMKLIGFGNPVNITKYCVWKKFGSALQI